MSVVAATVLACEPDPAKTEWFAAGKYGAFVHDLDILQTNPGPATGHATASRRLRHCTGQGQGRSATNSSRTGRKSCASTRLRYQEKVKGWWTDGCYRFICYDEEKLGVLADALRAGHTQRIAALNPGVQDRVRSFSRHEDFTTGGSSRGGPARGARPDRLE